MKRWLFLFFAILLFAVRLHADTLTSGSCSGGTTSSAGCAVITSSGFGTVGIQITGTFVGTLSFEITNDDTNWVAATVLKTDLTTTVSTTTTPGLFYVPTAGVKRVRVRFSAYTSGSAVVTSIRSDARLALPGGGGGNPFDPTADIAFSGDNTHTGAEVFKNESKLCNDTFSTNPQNCLVSYQDTDGIVYFNVDSVPYLQFVAGDDSGIAGTAGFILYPIYPSTQQVYENATQLLTSRFPNDVAVTVTARLGTPDPPAVSNIGTAGVSTVTYKVVGVTPNGYHTAVSNSATTNTSNATLNGSNFNRLTDPGLPGTMGYDIYRTAGGPTQGLIAAGVNTFPFDDTGLAGDASTPPTVNTTGVIAVSGGPLVLTGGALPTSCTGRDTGTLWSDSGTVKVCP